MGLRYALLTLLREQPDYGYRLKRRFDERTAEAWQLNVGQVYQTLRALVDAGLVTEITRRAEPRRPVRRLFEITPRGVQALECWLDRPPSSPRLVRSELLLRLLATHPGVDTRLSRHVREQEDRYANRLRRLEARKGQPPGRATAWQIVRQLALEEAILHTEAHLRWLAHCREVLAAGLPSLPLRRSTPCAPRGAA